LQLKKKGFRILFFFQDLTKKSCYYNAASFSDFSP